MAITATDIQEMVSHWLSTPVNGYLGSSYGADLPSLLFAPLTSGAADAFLAKLKADVPVLASLPAGAVDLYSIPEGPDKLRIYIDVLGTVILLDDAPTARPLLT